MANRRSGASWLAQLRSPDERIAHEARLFLGGLTPSDAWMLDDFLDGSTSGDGYIRFWSAVAAHGCAVEHSGLARRMADLLGDPSPSVRSVAAQTLIIAAPTAETAARLADLARSDPDAYVRQCSARALGRSPESLRAEAVAHLLPLLVDREIANAVAITIKVIVLAEGGVPDGVEATSVGIAVRDAARLADADTASQLQVILDVLERG